MSDVRSRRTKTRAIVAAALAAGGIAALPAAPAAAHVHGITPLRCVAPDAGATATESTPAFAPNGPLSGLIPSSDFGSPGQSPLKPGDGGFDTPACPAA